MTGRQRRRWTEAQVRALGVRTTVPVAGDVLAGLCRDESYRAVKRGTFPVPVIKVGHRLVVPTAPILELLGIRPDKSEAAPVTSAASEGIESPATGADERHATATH